MTPHEPVRLGGRNIFEDLRLPDAEELNAKAQIAYRICDILQERKLSQKEAATVLGIDQPKVSALLGDGWKESLRTASSVPERARPRH